MLRRLFPSVWVLILAAGCRSTAPVEQVSANDGAYWAEQAGAVRQEYRHAWRGYTAYAWGHDDLRPLSRSYRDWYDEPLMVTAVDALDGLILLGLDDEADELRAYLDEHLTFDRDVYASTFEVTIRLLGSLLSSHQLTGDARLLALAEDLGRRLLPAFASPTGMPYRFVNLRTGAVRGAVSNPAEVGTLIPEMGTLSRLTGDPVFYERARQALVAVYERRSGIDLVGAALNVETGAWVDTASHLGGGIDSYYEYLLKAGMLFDDAALTSMWETHRAAIHRHLAAVADSSLWYGTVDMRTGEPVAPLYGALHAYFPAVLVLDGDVARADSLHRSSMKMWALHGLEPELLNYATMKVASPAYHLRPEIVESAFYLFRATGETAYRRMGETLFQDLRQYCRTDAGYAAVSDVRTKTRHDLMESYLLGETLKYLYLLFAPEEALDLEGVVLTTEAHPLRRVP